MEEIKFDQFTNIDITRNIYPSPVPKDTNESALKDALGMIMAEKCESNQDMSNFVLYSFPRLKKFSNTIFLHLLCQFGFYLDDTIEKNHLGEFFSN